MEVSRREFEELKAKVISFEKEHRAFHSSRRGVAGPTGERGPVGVGLPGPPGPPGPAYVPTPIEAAETRFSDLRLAARLKVNHAAQSQTPEDFAAAEEAVTAAEVALVELNKLVGVTA